MSSSLGEPLTGDNRLPQHDVRGGSDPRGGDLVSRLLAATPSYLYSFAPPNTFFFSEMLRSFVHAKQPLDNPANPTVCGPPNNPGVPSGPGLGIHHNRRPRKRSWREQGPGKMPLGLLQPHSGLPQMSSVPPAAPIADKPLELTTTHRSSMSQPPHQTQPPPPPPLPPPLPPPPPTTSTDEKPPSSPNSATSSSSHPNPLINLLPPCNPLPDAQLPSDLILPSTQPLWYPHLYPFPGGHQQPYGFDPLHFFIDLRVSGQIFDRNKNGKDEPEDVKVKQSKHCSAFSVPQPRNHESQNGGSSQELPRPAPNSTHYVMQNLSRIYDDVRTLHNRPSPKRSPSPPPRKCEDSNNNSRSSDDEDNKPVVVDCEKTEEATTETKEEDMTEEEREAKKAKDLRALIGLELVVDYVNHNEDGSPKKRSRSSSEEDDVPADVEGDGSESLARSASSPASVCSRSRSRTPSPPPRVCSPVPPPPFMTHGQMYHDFHHIPPVFLRERSDALNLQVRHH